MGDARESWVTVSGGTFVLYEAKDKDEGPDSDLFSLTIVFDGRNRRSIILTNLTQLELDALRKFFNRAFDKAQPIVEELDRRAAAAWEAGDDSYSRSYRAVPELIVREQRKSEHDSGVQDGPDESVGDDGTTD